MAKDAMSNGEPAIPPGNPIEVPPEQAPPDIPPGGPIEAPEPLPELPPQTPSEVPPAPSDNLPGITASVARSRAPVYTAAADASVTS